MGVRQMKLERQMIGVVDTAPFPMRSDKKLPR
jgi:hypothetical protein